MSKLSAEDKALLAQLRAEQESDEPVQDKVNGKPRVKGSVAEEAAPTPGARAKSPVIDVELSEEDDDADPPADKKPTKAPPKRVRRAPVEEPEPVEDEPAAVVPELDTIQLGPTPRQTLAMMALPVACEFCAKDASIGDVVEAALEFADAVLSAK